MAGTALMRRLLKLVLGLIVFGTVYPAQAADKPLLTASTEIATKGETRPSAALVGFVIHTLDGNDREQLDDCIAEKALKRRDYAMLLRAVPVRNATGRTLWFVRPAQLPYCQALYGAHLFRYFLVEDRGAASAPRFKMLFRNGGDGFAIYPSLHHGLNDIEPTGCIASGCRSARLAYDGRAYRPVRCTSTTSDDNGREVTLVRRCGADDGSDYQSTGLLDR